ncbi:MAG: hypothetical protein ACP5DY_07620 [Thermovirgaceae bacterium]
MQGGRPKDTAAYRAVSDAGVTLWVPEEIRFVGDVIRFRRGSLRRKNLFFAEGAVIF